MPKKMTKWQNNFISGKLFLKRPNYADLAFLKAKWQPWQLGFAFVVLMGSRACHSRERQMSVTLCQNSSTVEKMAKVERLKGRNIFFYDRKFH
jgi:hypothetical protein